MNQKVLFAASFALTAGAAFIAGRASSSQPDASEDTASTTPPPRLSRSGSATESGFAGSQRSKLTGREPRDRSSSETEALVQEMVDIMASTDPLTRTQEWLDFVNGLDPDRFEEVVAEFRAKGLTNGNMTEYAMVLTAWAKVDPLSALDYAKENTGSPFARNTILASWAGTDPNGAIQWAESNHDGDGANPWMVGVIKGVVANDPYLATELLGNMPYSEQRGDALTAILPHVLNQGPEAARQWVAGLSDDRLRNGAIQRMAGALAKTDPEGTANWLASTPGDGATGAMDNVIGTWAREDIQAATSYYQGLPAGELRTSALRGLSNQLAMSDPQAAASLIDANPGDASDRVYQQFVWHSFREDPALAANYIGRIENDRERDSTYRRMLEGWLRRDFDSANAWISSNELPEDVSKRIEGRIREMEQRQQ
ncbi:hypothetical protein [Haloferula rosea]|uniref:HEAT repeat domain-containing protein n=1 Tax=Haloferula rosea TaxID=490093 RepID=A0A934VED9_9BACT|nr:hypothetical protein [Haloferula rosea]MBK1825946.1 hypothetical protein [Haloferula rosea]